MTDKADGFKKLKKSLEKSENLFCPSVQQVTEIQKVLLSMLNDFVAVAEKYNLNYSLSGGSVLGAIRHNGFIPWDDDIDINMPRKDFLLLLSVFEKELGKGYELKCPEQKSIHGLVTRQIRKKGTICCSFHDIMEKRESCGVAIDIFVLENTYDNRILRKIHGVLCLGMGYLLACRRSYEEMRIIKRQYPKDAILEEYLKKRALIGRIIRFLPLGTVLKWTAKCYSMCKDNDSRFVTIPSGRKHFFGELAERKEMCKFRKAHFEGVEINIPEGTRQYMFRLYGNGYMTVPEEKDREQHPLVELNLGGEGK